MPAAGRETAVNKALSGQELKRIMLADFEKMLDNEGLLSPHIAYGRVSYTLISRLHMDNPMRPESEIRTDSRPVGRNLVEGAPQYGAIEAPPLGSPGPSPDAIVSSTTVDRLIDSPNVERIRLGIPVPVNVKQQDGTVSQELVTYPPQPELGDGQVQVTDSTEEAAREWGVRMAEADMAGSDPT
jgi:hypothetical protein